MLDERDLQAIAQLMDRQLDKKLDEKLDTKLSAMEQKFDEKLVAMEQRLDDKMDAKLVAMEQRLDGKMDTKLTTMKQELKTEISHEIRALIEVEVRGDLKALSAGHALIIQQMVKKEDLENFKADVQTDIDFLKAIVRQHSTEIEQLKRAQ